MDGHLISIEIRIVGSTDQGVKLNCLTLNENRLKCLDAEPVEGWGPVKQDGMLPYYLLQDIPNLGTLCFHHLPGTFDSGYIGPLLKFVIDKRLEKLQGHLLGKPALMQPQLRTNDNHGPT